MKRRTLWFLFIVALAGCAGTRPLVIEVPGEAGRTVLTYAGKQAPERLLSEVRLSATGDTVMVTPMLKGNIHGTVMSYHPNGKRDQTIEYVNGHQEGIFRKYDNEGVLLMEGRLVDGKKQGVWTVWYDETQMSEQCNYVNDVRNGNCTFWYLDGNLKAEESYDQGKMVNRTQH